MSLGVLLLPAVAGWAGAYAPVSTRRCRASVRLSEAAAPEEAELQFFPKDTELDEVRTKRA